MKETITETADHIDNIIFRIESTFGNQQLTFEQKSFFIGQIASELEFIKRKLEIKIGK